MKAFIVLIVLFVGMNTCAEAQTAEEILDKSIALCGGVEKISKIKSTSLLYDLTTSDSSHTSLIMKRQYAQKYMQSTLSETNVSSSLHYDGSSCVAINGEDKMVVRDLASIDEMKLRLYDHIQFAYKQLGYELNRLEDQKFASFDCYTISATSKKGYMTLNYFDKTDFHLLMIIYPDGSKSVIQDYGYKDDVLFNTKVVNVDQNSNQTTLMLQSVNLNTEINPLWFSPGKSKSTAVPLTIKEGTFIASNGIVLNRTATVQTEKGPKGDWEHRLYLNWFNNYIYAMVNSRSVNKKPPYDTGDNILVKIVGWNESEYVCHFYTNRVSGTADYKLKK